MNWIVICTAWMLIGAFVEYVIEHHKSIFEGDEKHG